MSRKSSESERHYLLSGNSPGYEISSRMAMMAMIAVVGFFMISFEDCCGSLPSCKASLNEEKTETTSCKALDEALSLIKKAHDIMRKQADDVRKEKAAFESVAKKLEHVHFASTIKLNVGGQLFTTSLQTLRKDTGSLLHAMFSGRFDTKPAENGSYFIDRDGTHFRYILNYLRTGRLLLPDDELVRKELLEEAEFYQIRGIVDELVPQPFHESKILSTEQKQVFINTWLKEQLNRHHSTFVLLYRASRDGFSAFSFHVLCDKKGPTVTVVKSGNNVFGGYTEQSWDVSNDYKHCTECFLFSLVNPGGVGPTKLPIKVDSAKSGMYCHISYGPTFGEAYDLLISSKANECSDSHTSRLGSTYKCPAHITPSTFFTGKQNFVVDELEVFVYRAE